MARFQAILRAATVAACLSASVAVACPFCGVVGQSLAQRRDEADVVAVGEADGEPAGDSEGLPSQRFRVHQLLRGEFRPAGGTITARVLAPATGTAILFARDTDDGGLRWSAMQADEAVLGHVAAAPAWVEPPAERLRWYAKRLEHPDPAIAADAFTEFGLAPYAAVRAASDAFDTAALRRWVIDPGIDQRRRGFYGLAVGIVAAAAKSHDERAASVGVLRDAVTAPASEFRAGFDGLLGGMLVAEGESAMDVFEEMGLFAASARPADQKHLLAALRFAGEELADTIPRPRVAAATARLLASPATATDATIDLARYAAWEHAEAVAALWDRLGGDDPLLRRAVAGYLSACPRPEARRLLEVIRGRDPARLDAAMKAAQLPR